MLSLSDKQRVATVD